MSRLNAHKCASVLVCLQVLQLADYAVFALASSAQVALPPCTMDSFVHEAKGRAELIYGDESFEGRPPYMSFDATHRISNGIFDQRDQGLTTGHGSLLPDAWGGDEFIGLEQSVSGPQQLISPVQSDSGINDYSGYWDKY